MKFKIMRRIIYMGTPGFATEPLRALFDAGYDIAAVITAPDKPSGRGLQVNVSDVKKCALELGLNILQPTSLKEPGFLNQLKSLKADLFIVVAFRMLPKEVWSIPSLGCFNLHASLLPQYRGAAPINHSLINGETITGVTTFFIDSKIDTGDILFQESCVIEEKDNAGTLHDKLMNIGAKLVVKTANAIFEKSLSSVPQSDTDEPLKTAPKLSRETGKISWKKSNIDIHNQVRGLSPYPAAYTEMICGDKIIQIKIFETEIVTNSSSGPHGSIIKESKHSFIVSCGQGYLRILDLQPAGKRRMKASEFLAGIREPENCSMK
jgi:methionyl-tRNA formyltransferase